MCSLPGAPRIATAALSYRLVGTMAHEQDLSKNYAGCFNGHLGFGKSPALLIIDFVQVGQHPQHHRAGTTLDIHSMSVTHRL